MPIDTHSEPGAWAREIAQRPKGIHEVIELPEGPQGPAEVTMEQRADDLENPELDSLLRDQGEGK